MSGMNDEHERTLKELSGVWRLVSSEFRTSSGEAVYPLGENAQGQAIFTDSGYLSAQLMRPGRPNFASGDQAGGTPREVQAALQGYAAYYGRCELDVKKRTITTTVEGSLFPNWVGSRQLRYYELSSERLILKTPPISFGDAEFTGVLSWERVPGQ